MKAKTHGFLLIALAVAMLAMPLRALADHDDDEDGWRHHDHGHHYGWFKHHDRDDYIRLRRVYPPPYVVRPVYPAPYPVRPIYPAPYPGRLLCDEDGDDCRPAPPFARPYPGNYAPPYPYPSYYSSPYPQSGAYASHAAKLMQLRASMTQRLNADRQLYSAAMGMGNFQLANTVQIRMQNEIATINQANAELGGGAIPSYSAYGQQPYYGASPLNAVTRMLGY